MTDECIHGLDLTRCAGCNPAPAPVQVTATKVSTRTRSATSNRKSPTPRKPATPKNAPPLDDIGQQRVYHVTHVDNLVGILEAHAIFADASDRWAGERPAIDIAATATREARRAARTTGLSDVSVADYVPFALSPNASFWSSVRDGSADGRLASEIGRHSAADFVVLVTTVKSLRESHPAAEGDTTPLVVLADADAGGAVTRFTTTPTEFARVLGRLRSGDDEALLEPELLVLGSLSFDFVSLIGVANDKVREVVRRMLDQSGYEHRVAVYPPWYVASEG